MQPRLDPGLVKKELLEALLGQLAKFEGLLWWFSGKEFACSAGDSGDTGSISGLGTCPGGGSSNPLQYFCLENSMDRDPGGLQSMRSQSDITEHTHSEIRVWTTDSGQFSSVTQSCPTPCDLMNCSTPGFPAHHQLMELTQTYVHWVGDAIQPSHPLLSPSPSSFNLS